MYAYIIFVSIYTYYGGYMYMPMLSSTLLISYYHIFSNYRKENRNFYFLSTC